MAAIQAFLRALAGSATIAIAVQATAAHAQSDPADTPLPAAPEARQSAPGGEVAEKPGEQAASGLWQRANLLGDLGGLRTRLSDAGVSFGLLETSEVLGNPTGGERRGVVYEGLTSLSMGIDTEKLFGLAGGTLNVSAYQIHGRGLSLNNLDNNLMTVSSIEALRGTLLFELWYEQALFDKTIAVRVGQLAADQEFMVSQYGTLFINHTFGWSTFPSTDLPSGGPAYPLATPGVRVRLTPRDDLAFLVGVFNGNPAVSGAGFPQNRDPSGTAFRTNDGVLAIAEAQVAINQGDKATGLPGTYKLGAYYNSDAFANQNGNGQQLRGNWAGYAVMDQLVFREAGTKDQGAGVFARVMGGPGDRNLVNFYVDAGVTYKGLLPGRDADTAGLAVAVARISDTASQFDAAQTTLSPTLPIRRHETVLELTYQAQLAPWWQVQPTAQYVFNLNGGVPNPLNPTKRLGDAAVFGLRTNVTF